MYDNGTEKSSKEALSEMDTAKRDTLFMGDCIEKRELKASLEQQRLMR